MIRLYDFMDVVKNNSKTINKDTEEKTVDEEFEEITFDNF